MSADMLLIIDCAKESYKDEIKAVKHTQTTLRKHKKNKKNYTTVAANVCHMDFLIEKTELSNRLIPYLDTTDRISCWQLLRVGGNVR